MTAPGAAQPRAAVWGDVAGLTDLERRTNTVALAHVFDPGLHRFPTADVRLRWERLVDDIAVDVLVVDGSDGDLAGVVSVGGDRVGHLLVVPPLWGTGLGARLLATGVARLRAAGTRRAELTCLVANARARAFYEREGWHEAGSAGRAPWPPYPPQLTYALDLTGDHGGHAPE